MAEEKSDNSGQQQGNQGEEPKWLSQISDAALREEAKSGWLRQQDYTKKTQELADQRKQYEAWEGQKKDLEGKVSQWNDWYNQSYVPLYNWYQGQQANGTQNRTNPNGAQQANNAAEQVFRDYDTLTSQQQAKAMSDYLRTEFLEYQKKDREDFNKQYQNDLKTHVDFFQNYMKIFTDAVGKKLTNPGLDVNAFMQKALEIKSGQVDPLELAYKIVTEGPEREKLIETARQQGKADFEQEQKNKQTPTPFIGRGIMPTFKPPQRSGDAGLNTAITEKFGADVW